MPAPKPTHEAQRLAALRSYDILDTPPEVDFDAVTRLAAHVCKAPIAVVNFIDGDRQWFKSEIGLGVRETPLDVSICAHAILQPGLFIVPDTLQDPRFAGNPLVTGEPGLRFYAGALLETPEGQPLGTVCVLDYQPRALTAEQGEVLQMLARQVMVQLELRRAVELRDAALAERRRAEERQRFLMAELDHRLKNALATAAALAQQTFGDREEKAVFSGRIDALVKAHALLSEGRWQGASLRRVAEAELAAYRSAAAGRILIEGPDVVLPPLPTQSLGLAIHELATNAAKYGALGAPSGRIELRWTLADGPPPLLRVEWLERDGPPVGRPTRRGFGSRMIEQSVAYELGGLVELDFDPAGVRCVIEIPLGAARPALLRPVS